MRTLLIGLCTAALLIIYASNTEVTQARPIEVSYKTLIPEARTQVDCLAQNIYYEAGNQGKDGRLAVALVTMNRVEKNFSRSICSVVKQKTGSVCQFSWKCQSVKKPDPGVYQKARETAIHVYLNYGNIKDITKGATYYHADYVNPGWNNLKQTAKIGQHIFYKPKKELNYDEQTKSSPRRWKPGTKLFLASNG
jgi:spore germination cell wall hydrolase CwlJ-like protein